VLRGGVGSRRKGLGFSLCAAPSRLAGPCISELGRVESRRSPGEVYNVVGIKIRGLRSEMEAEVEAELELEELRRCQNFAKRSRELDQVVDSIFELKIIHAREVAYKWSRTIGG
jgi:hypothetical protein